MSTDILTNGLGRQDTRSSIEGPAQRSYDNVTLLDVLLSGMTGGVIFVAAFNTPDSLKSLTDSNYVCDGTDDHLQINLALTNGNRVVLLPGNYTTGASINIPSNRHMHVDIGVNITLSSSSDTTILTNSDSSGGNNNIVVTGQGTFNHNGSNQTSSTHGILFDNVNDLSISDFYVTGGRGWDLRLESCTRFSLNNITSYGPGGSSNSGGIQIRKTCSYGKIDNAIVYGHTDGSGYGLWVMGKDIDVVSCNSYGNDDDNLVVGSSLAGDAERITFHGGTFKDSVSDAGCHVTNGCNDIVFLGTRFEGNDLIGIKVAGTNIFRVTLNGIICENNGTDGITMSGSGGTSLVNSRIENNGGRGLFFAGGTVSRYQIIGNAIRGNTDSNIEGHATASISDILISNNIIENSSDWGIDFNGTKTEIMLLGNYIEGNTSGGVDGGGSSSGVTAQNCWGAQAPSDIDERS